MMLDSDQIQPLIKQSDLLKKIFFYTILGFNQSLSGPLGDIEGFIQLIPCKYKSRKLIGITGVEKIHLKCDCINASIVNSVRQTILYSFALSLPPGHKVYNEHRVKFFKKMKKSVLSQITFI